jgi:surface polysaccharide O-acyltransferase-like enzyme
MKSSLGTFQPAKGLLMLTIISSHTASVFWPVPRTSSQAAPALTALQLLSDLLRYAAMPCFFMICGYGFRRRRLPILMRNTVAPIAKAYLITSLLIVGIAAIRAVAESALLGYATLFLLRIAPLPSSTTRGRGSW